MHNLLTNAKLIAEGHNSQIFLYDKDPYGRPVIFKVLKDEFIHYPRINQIVNEDQHIRNINIKGVRCSIDRIEVGNKQVLVLEYFEGVTLAEIIRKQTMTVAEKLQLAVRVTSVLGEIHHQNIVHKDINSQNILINSEGDINIIDFGFSANLKTKLPFSGIPENLEGTLQYISPEQTGRIDHPVDHRSDLYSLGIILYELFTGQLPFPYTDPTELVHAHLAMQARALQEIDNKVPSVISDIVLKLLAKNISERYQTCYGLMADLQQCLAQIESAGELREFAVGKKDYHGKLVLPTKLYGRKNEVSLLLNTYDKVRHGSSEVMLIPGPSGSGKTSLVTSIKAKIVQGGGHFIVGKNEQYQQDVPYYALVQAMNEWVNLLLSKTEQELTYWKTLMASAIGSEGKLLIDIAPKLELIIGKQEDIEKLEPTEAQHRFIYTFSKFIKAIATQQNPLVIFIDDLQWVDIASLKVLKNIICDTELSYFYFIGAYRINEVDRAHPIAKLFSSVENQGVSIQRTEVNDLTILDIGRVIRDTFSLNEGQEDELTNIVYMKTAGNPFFVNQFLQSMYDAGFILFKHTHSDLESYGGKWKWDTTAMLSTNFTDNVVEFMITRIRHLSQRAQEILKIASCIGDKFSLSQLSILLATSISSIKDVFNDIISEQLVVECINNSSSEQEDNIQYKFVHDRVYQAAYELLSDHDKANLHHSIGNLLLKQSTEEDIENKIFDLVFQFNRGNIQEYSEDEREKLVELNIIAGNKAKLSFANQEAVTYYETAISLMNKRAWEERHLHVMQLYNSCMECAYLAGQYDKMNQYGESIQSHSTTIQEEINAYKIRIYAFVAQNKFLEATQLGLEILDKLGVYFPKKPSKLSIITGLIKTKIRLSNKSIKDLESLSKTQDEHVLGVLSLIVAFAAAAYHKVPELFPLVIFKTIELAVKHGNSLNNIPSYGGYGILLCGVTGEINKGFEYGQLSLRLAESHEDHKQVKAKCYLIFTTFINHWKDHLRKSIPMLEQSYTDAMETGDQEYAAASLFMHSYHSYFIGESLDTLTSRVKTYHRKTNQLKQQSYGLYSSIFYQALLNLISQSKHPTTLSGNVFDERRFLSETENNNPDKTALFHIYFNKLMLAYWLESYEEALKYSVEVDKNLEVTVSTIFTPIFYFYDSLVKIAIFQKKNKTVQKTLLKRISENQKKVKKWSDHAPMNFLHQYLLVEGAKKIFCFNQRDEGQAVLENGLAKALENGFSVDLAIGYELAFHSHHNAGNKERANHYLRDAFQLYHHWGAKAKKKFMQEKYFSILEENSKAFSVEIQGFSSMSSGSQLDLAAILKASAAISSEIRLNRVIHQLLKIVIENAGAESGVFLINNSGTLEIHATGKINDEIKLVPPREISGMDPIPLSIIQYVSRSSEYVVLADALQDSNFSLDQYIQSNQTKSVLCIPIISKNILIGIIYLENNLAHGAFTTKRLSILQMLSGQIAITLENSILYASLEQKVMARTEELDRQKEELKKNNLELMSINQEKNDLINIVSHDLRSPLTQIKGLASLVSLTPSNSNNDIKEYTDKIIKATDRLNSMITRILDISAIEAQKIEINPESFDIIKEVRLVIQNFETVAKEKSITLKFHANVDEGEITLDRNYLIQILDNLISNAVKFSYEHDVVEVNVTYEHPRVKIEIKDNGPGISSSDQKMLFSKFQKLTAQPTAGEKSSGLGLSIVKRYVEAMEGKIWCKSSLNNGASFFIEF